MQEFKRLLREDTIDYATYTANIKRKHPTPRNSRSGKAARGKGEDDMDEDDDEVTIDCATYTANVKRKHPTPRSSRSAKAARGKGEDDEDEDDDDDDDWTGGSRRLNFSNLKSNGGRVTRLRS